MDTQHNERLIFLYDSLMTKQQQQLLNIDLEFVTFGIATGKLRGVTVRLDKFLKIKNERLFLTANNGTNIVFGAIFIIKDYNSINYKLHSYYYNSIPIIGKTIKEDLFDFVEINARPIKFDAIEDLRFCDYEIGNPVVCNAFIGNQSNNRIAYNSSVRGRTYGRPNIDKESYIQMIKERQEVIKNELE